MPSFLEQASLWGQAFEVAVKRGVLAYLIDRHLLPKSHPVLAPWYREKNINIYRELLRGFQISDPNAQDWLETMVSHLLVLGYGLGWTAMRACLQGCPIRQPTLEAIWCPLLLPGQQKQRDEERRGTAREFAQAFNLPGNPDENLLKRGEPGRADFLLWLSPPQGKKGDDFLLCLEFSYNVPTQLEDFRTQSPHLAEIERYMRYQSSRGVFSRVCAEVEGEQFLLSSGLESFLSAFSGQDKPLYKLTQASSYTERLVHLLRVHQRVTDVSTRAIAITSNGFESLAADFNTPPRPLDPRAKLMQSLGKAYRHSQPKEEPNQLEQDINLAFNKLVANLPQAFRKQAREIRNLALGEPLHLLFQETVEGFHHPMQSITRAEAIAAIQTNSALREFLGEDPQTQFSQALHQVQPDGEALPLRSIHEAAVITGLKAAQNHRLNLIALEGNPGIGKTTAVIKFLKQQTQGFLFLYISPRVAINRSVTAQLAKEKGNLTGILTLTSNANLIKAAPAWYEKHGQADPSQKIDSAVVVDGIASINPPRCSTAFLTPEQEMQIENDIVSSSRSKRSLSQREDLISPIPVPGVLRTLAGGARKMLESHPQVNRLVITTATQGYRSLEDQKNTVSALNHLFKAKANVKAGVNERLSFASRIPTIIVMVDELAGDGAGAPFVHELAKWLHQQFIAPFAEGQSPFKVMLIMADASLSNPVVFNSFLNSGERAPDKVLISPSQGSAPFEMTGTDTKVGSWKFPTLHVMTNSFPASQLTIDYSIRLSSVKPQLNRDGTQQSIRQAIREKWEEQLLDSAYQEIKQGLKQGAEQIIFFAQDKAFLRQLREKLIAGYEAIFKKEDVQVLDQSVSPAERVKLIEETRRDRIRVFLMTSSGSRGVSFPKTDWIIAAIPRFNIEQALMEVAQLIYRGRGMYTHPETGEPASGDDKARRLVMLINDFLIEEEEKSDRSRHWLRQASDLLTLLVMLRSTIYTRITGDAGLRKQQISFVPVGSIGDEELLSLMSEEIWSFLHEAKVFVYDSDASAELQGTVKKAEQLIENIFAQFTLKGLAPDRHALSYCQRETLEKANNAVSALCSPLVSNSEDLAIIIPENISCMGSFWAEDWSDRIMEEKFSFEGWRKRVYQNSSQLLSLLKQIYQGNQFPPKLKRPAKELYKLLVREQSQRDFEYATLQPLKTRNLVVSLPLDYPQFCPQADPDATITPVLEHSDRWRRCLGRSLSPQGLLMPVIPQYRSFPWVAVAGKRILEQLEIIFSDRYFMASSELNLLNVILLEDE
ncbi:MULTISPECIES: helicase-related protein [Desertifilum]|uniref:Helicase n=1 Tax=Desertifilum tharense IPPAS B-1220 TaxID=1781255 RepID=A0A1E5QG64_9CYAN|nr:MULTISPECIES: helicase-related protein [Desertifilum]MDA0212080.1 helicase-related protein [Cyanobacteria bacterium FC1]OEJ73581.1 helicase [Desertifilum tharense IPPAS B-1220]